MRAARPAETSSFALLAKSECEEVDHVRTRCESVIRVRKRIPFGREEASPHRAAFARCTSEHPADRQGK